METYIKCIFIFCLLFKIGVGQTNKKHEYQKSYIKKNGTLVQGHQKTKKNTTDADNFTTKPNTNPYTGKKGTKQRKK